MSPHLVADEIARRGIQVEHLISWDDYDRFRKVPNGIEGVDATWSEHIGKPLTSVPAPPGSTAANWADHFRTRAEEAFAALGIRYRSISQTQQYTSGAYTEQILSAMRQRREIDAILAQYRTLPGDRQLRRGGCRDAGRARRRLGCRHRGRRIGWWIVRHEYYPYKPYCTDVRHRPHDHHGVRRRHHRDDLLVPVRSQRDSAAARLPLRQARLEGRLADALGLREGRVRAVGRRPPVPRLVVRGRPAARAALRLGAAVRPRLLVRRLRRRRQDVVVAGRGARPG